MLEAISNFEGSIVDFSIQLSHLQNTDSNYAHVIAAEVYLKKTMKSSTLERHDVWQLGNNPLAETWLEKTTGGACGH